MDDDMEPWIDEVADALGVSSLSPEDMRRILGAARDVAHGVERRLTPLATFLMGLAVGARTPGDPAADAIARAAALDDVLATLRAHLPPAPPETPPENP